MLLPGPSLTSTRSRSGWWWLLLAVVAVLYCAVCARGIAAPWHWGHNGYNGAAFSQAAKNSERFGIIGQAQYHFEREPPPARAIYTHHPLALHAHLLGSFALFGAHEWSARLVPLAYSLATWLLLVIAVRRYWGDRTAALAGLAYALTPLNLIFANMVNHEQGGIFACLWLLYAYLRWFETGRRFHAILCAVAVTLAVQFDWPGYYVAFAVAAHCLVTGIRGKAPAPWRWFVVAFSAVTLANLFAFFGWVYLTRSGLQDMAEAFRLRNQTAPVGSYLPLIGRRLLVLHGPILLSAAAIGALGGLLAWKRRPLRARALLPLAFFFAGLVQVVVFPQAARLHSYWIYYWSPAIAIAAAVGLEALIDRGTSLASKWTGTTAAQTSAGAIVVLLFIATQGSFAWRTWREQLDHGHAADTDHSYFQRFERSWFTALGDQYDPARVRYALHASIREPRIELLYYLDAPHRFVRSVGDANANEVLLVDLQRLRPAERHALDSLTSAHSTVVWMDRFYGIDLRSGEPKMTRFEAVDDDPGWLKWWLTTQTSDPPLRWKSVP